MCKTTATSTTTSTRRSSNNNKNGTTTMYQVQRPQHHHHHPPAAKQPPPSCRASSSYLDLLPVSSSALSPNQNLVEEEEDLMDLMDSSHLSSINLEDSVDGLFDLYDDDNDDDGEHKEEENNHHNNSSSGSHHHFQFQLHLSPYDSLFDPQRQEYEWKDDFSILKKLRVTRLAVVAEEEKKEEHS